MLDMGFIRDIKKILALLPKRRQNLLFSATFSAEIRDLAKGLVNDPVEISVSPRNTTAQSVEQWLHPVDKSKKSALVTKLIKTNNWQQVLIFTRTKHGANRLTRSLEGKGIRAAAIHGNKSQGARTKALANFKSGDITVLVATDIAARGLDIEQLPQVVNFDLPNVPEDYVHRIGRTGRAGASGHAVSLVDVEEFKQLVDIERVIQKHVERQVVEGFEPSNPLPPSPAVKPIRNKKPKKAKQPKTEHQDGQRSGEAAKGHKPPSKNRRHRTGANQGGQDNKSEQGQGRRRSGGGGNSAGRGNSGGRRSGAGS
jgi:ATP-dependent RNA helicase RhlE